jgi:hypothetical protein
MKTFINLSYLIGLKKNRNQIGKMCNLEKSAAGIFIFPYGQHFVRAELA